MYVCTFANLYAYLRVSIHVSQLGFLTIMQLKDTIQTQTQNYNNDVANFCKSPPFCFGNAADQGW